MRLYPKLKHSFSLVSFYGTFAICFVALAVFLSVHELTWIGTLFVCLTTWGLMRIWKHHLTLFTIYTMLLGILFGALLLGYMFWHQDQNRVFIGHSGNSQRLDVIALQDSTYWGQRQTLSVQLEKSYGHGVSAQASGKLRVHIRGQQPRFFTGMRLYLVLPPETSPSDISKPVFVKKLTPGSFVNPIWAWRARIYNKIASLFSSSFGLRSGLHFALILGDRSALLPIAAYQIRHAGISHLLALSGLHLGLLSLLLCCVLSRFLTKKLTYLCSLPLLLGYVLFVGSPPSLVRAYISTALGILFWMNRRRVYALDMLAAVCFISLFINPSLIFSLSWQLSFLAVFGILLLYKDYKNSLSFLPKQFSSVLSVCLAVATTTTPFLAWKFIEAYPHGILATLVVIPVLLVWFVSSGLTILLNFLHPIFLFCDEFLWFIIRTFSWMPAWPTILAVFIFSILVPTLLYFILWRKNYHAYL